jgi:predicted small integral membrane protein
MTVSDFLQHWQLTENPFRGEEARSDAVFARMSTPAARPVQVASGLTPGLQLSQGDSGCYHSEFDKIVGDLRRPSSAVVFGEKGSGKTAIRLQLSRKVHEHNVANPGAKLLLVPYDDLNPMLDTLLERVGGKTKLEGLQRVRLVDHMDALLHLVVPRLVDALLGHVFQGDVFELPADAKKSVRKLDRMMRRELLFLQALYDRPEHAWERTHALRRRLGIWPAASIIGGRLFVYGFPFVVLSALLAHRISPLSWVTEKGLAWGALVASVLYALVVLKVVVWDRLTLLRNARRVRRQIRVLPRGHLSYLKSLRLLPTGLRDASNLPVSDADTPRYASFARLLRVLRCYGYTGMLVIVDRLDEPTSVAGDPERMRAVVWPMLNNKFLQQEGVGIKLLLPLELRHAILKESAAFFQEARLDKQHLVEELGWSGHMLLDLCDSRLSACRLPDAPRLDTLELFAEDVSRQDLLDALEKVRQPRDAFKLIYRCMTEHCANFTKMQSEWRISRSTLLQVAKAEQARVQQVLRGIRPA